MIVAPRRSLLARYWAVLLFVVVAGVVAVNHPYENEPVIRSDGLGYHAWTRALLDRHVSFCDYQELRTVAAITSDPETGRCPNKYGPGLALLRFPVMGPITALNDGELRSSSEDIAGEVLSLVAGAVAVGGIVVAALWLGVRAWIANIAATAAAFGTGLFHYATFDGSFTHVYSAALVSAMVVFGVRTLLVTNDDAPTIRSSRARDAAVAFVLAGFLISIRLPSMLVVAALAATAVFIVRGGRNVLRPRLVALLVGAGAATAIVLVWQIAYNRFMRGVWSVSSYAGEEFVLDQLKQADVLASFQKGLITWYPIVVVVVLAAVLARNWSGLAFLAVLVLPLAALYGAWHAWDLSGGFGHRGFVEVAPAFGLVLAMSLERVAKPVRSVVLVASGVAVVMTLGLLAAYWDGDVSFYGIDAGEWARYTAGGDSFPIVVFDWVSGR